MKLVIIEWMDSHSSDSWCSLDRIENLIIPYPVKSVGWIVGESSKVLTISSSLGHDNDKDYKTAGSMYMTIPKKCIVKTRVLIK